MPVNATIFRKLPRSWRVATAVFALYALVLQAVLGGAAVFASDAAHRALCLQQTGDGQDNPDTGPGAHHGVDCCAVSPVAAGSAIPPHPFRVMSWGQGATAESNKPLRSLGEARAPPGSIASPRAPPVI